MKSAVLDGDYSFPGRKQGTFWQGMWGVDGENDWMLVVGNGNINVLFQRHYGNRREETRRYNKHYEAIDLTQYNTTNNLWCSKQLLAFWGAWWGKL